jgi:hypothetical protein
VIYVWRDEETGREVEVERKLADIDVPPEEPGDWSRVLAPFGTGRVEGAGGSGPSTSVFEPFRGDRRSDP